MCRLRRHGLPGPAPAGGPTSCTPKKSAEEGRSRGLPPVPLRNPREYLAMTRRLPSLPTGTPAVGTTQVADAPNDGNNGAANLPGGGTRGRVADPPPVRRTRIGLTDRGVSCGQGPQLTCALRSQRPKPDGSPKPAAENNARSGRSRALRACAAKPRSFPPPRGRCAPRKSGRASPNVFPVRFRRLSGRGIALAARRLAGCCRLVR